MGKGPVKGRAPVTRGCGTSGTIGRLHYRIYHAVNESPSTSNGSRAGRYSLAAVAAFSVSPATAPKLVGAAAVALMVAVGVCARGARRLQREAAQVVAPDARLVSASVFLCVRFAASGAPL